MSIDALLAPHVFAVALISARLVPVAFLCPLFGGAQAPMHVKLGLVLSLACCLHFAGGVGVHELHSTLDLVIIAAKEVLFGTTIGLLAALPFDVARMGGKFIDLFRGSSAEAALPLASSKEAASGEALYQLLLAIGSVGVVMPMTLHALFKSFALVPFGGFEHSEFVAMEVTKWVGTAVGTALAIGAPVAGAALTIDLALGLAARAAPNMNLNDAGSPLRILAGGALVWLIIGLIAQRLLDFASASNAGLLDLMHRATS